MIDHLTFSQTALAALLLLLFAGFWGCPTISLVCELTGTLTKRIFLDKLALQMARLGTLIHLGVWAGGVASCLLVCSLYPPLLALSWQHALWLFPLLGLSLTGTILIVLVFTTWKHFKKAKKPLHIALGFAGLLCLKPLFWVSAMIIRFQFLAQNNQPVPFLPPLDSTFWPLAIQWIFTVITLAAILGSIYLLIRRNRDDFGRDYYKFALQVCAKWAVFPLIGMVIACFWLAVLAFPQIGFPAPPSLLAAIAIRAFSLMPCLIIWILLIRNPNPLRFKGMILTTGLLAWIFLLGTITTLYEIIARHTGLYPPHTFTRELLTYLGLG